MTKPRRTRVGAFKGWSVWQVSVQKRLEHGEMDPRLEHLSHGLCCITKFALLMQLSSDVVRTL